jgi:hypothetical protein
VNLVPALGFYRLLTGISFSQNLESGVVKNREFSIANFCPTVLPRAPQGD